MELKHIAPEKILSKDRQPTLATIDAVKAGQECLVNITGLLVHAKITEVTKNQYGWDIDFSFISPAIVQWGDDNRTKGSNFLRECDGYFQGTLNIIS